MTGKKCDLKMSLTAWCKASWELDSVGIGQGSKEDDEEL
jgi:hypothetical protein